MAERKVLLCDVCERDIVPNQELWDRQGQEVHLVFAGYTQRMVLCEEHIKDFDKWRGVGKRTFEGTAPSHERLKYLPKKD